MATLAMFSNIQLKQVKEMNDHIEAKASRQANIAIRNHWMQSKQSKFYLSEYNRIKDHIGNNVLIPNTTLDIVKKRKKVLEKLGARGLDIGV